MYQFPNQQLYHDNHYQPCQVNIEDTIKQNVNTIPEPQFHDMTQNVNCNDSLLVERLVDNTKECEVPSDATNQKKKKTISKKLKVEKPGEDVKEKKPRKKRTSVDTSTFTIEERLVAGVWVHERTHTNATIGEIKNNFRNRFGRDPPSKTTLLTWERKLFSTGSVCDAPRTGRPINRKSRVSEVVASLRATPAMSVRARALQLQLPRSTLHNILRNDLPHVPMYRKFDPNGAEKQTPKKSAGTLRPEVALAPVTSAPVTSAPVTSAPVTSVPPAPAPPHYVLHGHAHHQHSHIQHSHTYS